MSVVNHPSPENDFTRIVEYKHLLNQTSPHTIYFIERSKDDGEPYYPVPNERNKDLYKKYQEMADKEKGVHFVGRLANYKYFNMDQAILNALEIFDKEMKKSTASTAAAESGELLLYNNTSMMNATEIYFQMCQFRKDGQMQNKMEASIRKDFKGKILYTSMGGESYIPHLETFTKSLIHLGIKEEDIRILCIDHACSRHFKSAFPQLGVFEYTMDRIENSTCAKNRRISNSRCLVSMGKSEVTLKTLNDGDAIFFLMLMFIFFNIPCTV